ncbi:MAG: hypothetical protein HOW97_38400 [Catenulispora sp.]|nr:hypothetical protein [Catenulispora sp.]
MNATVERERQDNERVPATIVRTWGGWPWRAECQLCTTNSPGQRTREEAREWADSHYHAFHEIS